MNAEVDVRASAQYVHVARSTAYEQARLRSQAGNIHMAVVS